MKIKQYKSTNKLMFKAIINNKKLICGFANEIKPNRATRVLYVVTCCTSQFSMQVAT